MMILTIEYSLIYMKKNSINFNHVSEDLSDEEIMKLKQWYVYYHKLYTCY